MPQTVFSKPLTLTSTDTQGGDISWVPVPFENTFSVSYARTFVGTGVIQLAASLTMLVGCAVVLFVINPALAAVALATVLPIFYVLKIFVTRIGPLFGSSST